MSALEILSDFKKESSKDYLNSMVDLETKSELSDFKISIEKKDEMETENWVYIRKDKERKAHKSIFLDGKWLGDKPDKSITTIYNMSGKPYIGAWEREQRRKEQQEKKINEANKPRDIKDLYIEQTREDAFVRKTIGRPKAPLIKKDPKNPVYGKPYTKEEYAIIDEYISKLRDNDNSTSKKISKIIDPTGISNWPDVLKAWNDGKFDYKDIVDPLTAIPVVGKIPKVIKAISLGASTYSEFDE